MTMDYGTSIPVHFNELFEKALFNYRQKQYDSQLARTCSTIRNVGATIQTDTAITWEKTGGNTSLVAKITAKGTPPDMIGVKGKETSNEMYQLAVGFFLNERDLALDPKQQTRKVEAATNEIRRLEDYLWLNGNTAPALSGISSSGHANPNGLVAAYGASSTGNSVDSIGNWRGTADTYRDIYTDIMEACDRIGDNFEPKFLIGKRIDVAPIRKMDDMRNKYSDQILDLFGATTTKDFIRTSAYCPAGYVYVVAQNMDYNEFLVSEDLRVDTTYGKKEGGNFYVELKEWINPCAFYNDLGASEIYTL
jgi:hypothetical protein